MKKKILYTVFVVVFTFLCTLGIVCKIQNCFIFGANDLIKLDLMMGYTNMYYDGDKSKAKDGIFKGLMNGLDDYSDYYSKSEYKKMKEKTGYYGIGVKISNTALGCVILKVVDDSPADKAGLKVGDYIKKIDNKYTSKMKSDELTNLIRGKKGTIVNLQVMRNFDKLDFAVERDKVDSHYASSEILTENTGYIKLDDFSDASVKDFKNEFKKIQESNVKNLIIDLRKNVGGVLESALEIMDEFLPSGLVTTFNGKDGSNEKHELKNDNELKYNLVVLVDGDSASCSEIMTSYIQENNYGKVVGQTTFGKGVYQIMIELKDGSAFKVTSGHYLTSKGNDIDKIGIEPDYKIDDVYNVLEAHTVDIKDDIYVKKALEVLDDK